MTNDDGGTLLLDGDDDDDFTEGFEIDLTGAETIREANSWPNGTHLFELIGYEIKPISDEAKVPGAPRITMQFRYAGDNSAFGGRKLFESFIVSSKKIQDKDKRTGKDVLRNPYKFQLDRFNNLMEALGHGGEKVGPELLDELVENEAQVGIKVKSRFPKTSGKGKQQDENSYTYEDGKLTEIVRFVPASRAGRSGESPL